MRRTIRFLVPSAAMLFVAASAANGQYEKTKSTLVVADRVEVPGAILEPGNYLVRIADLQANRNVIVFQSPDGTKTFATTIATPHRGARPPKETEFTFYTVPAGQPRVLRSWFSAEDPNGQDFYYPAERAAELRRITSEEVPVATAEMSAPAPPVASAPLPPKAETMPPPAPVPAETTVATAEPLPSTDEEKLPQTASPYPLIALLGTTSLAAAVALNRRRRSA